VTGDASSFHCAGNDKTMFVFKVFKDEEAARAKLFQFNVKGSEREYDLGKWKRRDFTPNTGVSINVCQVRRVFVQANSRTLPSARESYRVTLGPAGPLRSALSDFGTTRDLFEGEGSPSAVSRSASLGTLPAGRQLWPTASPVPNTIRATPMAHQHRHGNQQACAFAPIVDCQASP